MMDSVERILSQVEDATIVGYLLDALPVADPEKASGSMAFVLSDGRALVLGAKGEIWIEPDGEVHRAIAKQTFRLESIQADIERVAALSNRISKSQSNPDRR